MGVSNECVDSDNEHQDLLNEKANEVIDRMRCILVATENIGETVAKATRFIRLVSSFATPLSTDIKQYHVEIWFRQMAMPWDNIEVWVYPGGYSINPGTGADKIIDDELGAVDYFRARMGLRVTWWQYLLCIRPDVK